jgi:hypothetical protein
LWGEDGHTNTDVVKAGADIAKVFGGPVNPAITAGDRIIPGIARNIPEVSAQAATGAADLTGIELPKAIAADSHFPKFMGQVIAKSPGGGPLQEAIKTSVGQTESAVGRAADMAGGTVEPAAAGASFRQGIEGSFVPKTKQILNQAYDRVGQLTDKNATSPLSSTQSIVADIASRRQASGADDMGKAIDTVLGGVTRPGGLTFSGIKDLRTRVGEMLDTGIFPEGMSNGELKQIYGGLSDDLRNAAQSTGGPRAVAAFDRANNAAKVIADWKENLSKVLGADNRSNEGIAATLVRMAGRTSTADEKTLAMAKAAVPPEVWQDVASSSISRLGRAKSGDFSPGRFYSDYGALSDRGKRLLFGSSGNGEVLPYLDAIHKISQKFVEAGKLANTSGTAGHDAAYTMLGAAGTGLISGNVMAPLGVVGAVVGNNILARALGSKASAASMARWSHAYDALVTRPRDTVAMANFSLAGRNLANTITDKFGVQVDPAQFLKVVQSPQGASADGQQNIPRPPGQ